MKIIQIIQKAQFRGAEIFACQVSNHLLSFGHEVKMICLFEGLAPLPFSGEIIMLKRPASRRFVDIAGWRQLATAVNEFKPDVVMANAGDTLKFSVLSKLYFRWTTPVVFRNANNVSSFITSGLQRRFNKFLVDRLSHVISVSEICRLDFIKTYNISPERTTMIPIGIEQGSGEDHTQTISGLLKDGPVLLSVASFVPEKNHIGMLKIVKTLIGKGRNIQLLMVGEGRLRQEIEARIKEMDLGKHVLILGARTDIQAIMKKATCLILPSKIEGLPAVILEAMNAGLPVVAFNVGGISEVVRNEETGFLVDANDDAGFVKSMEVVLDQSAAVEIVRANAHELVSTHFRNEVLARKFEQVFQNLVQRG